MTATDELRRLLDERGVEYTVVPEDMYLREYIKIGNIEILTNDRDEVAVYYLTPEQAIEATLGRGECDAEVEVVEFSQMQEIHRFTCSECGESFGAEEHDGLFDLVLNKVKLPNFCPNCGRKVVDE